jgi:hypothetical protein
MEELYQEIKQKHHLPAFSLLDQEFEISTIEEETFILRNIRKKITEKIETSIKILDDLLHPEAGFASYRESNIFNEEERDAIIRTYKRLMYFNRVSTELSFKDSDDLNADFINSFMNVWPELRDSVLVFIRRLKDSWNKDITKKEVVGYLG